MVNSESNLFSVSLILPMYNEKEIIKYTLCTINEALLGISKDYEIIVCNDGSTDGSEKIVNGFLLRNNKIRLINFNKHMGYGYAIRAGFKSAIKDIICYTDSDLPCDISILNDKLHLLNKVNIIIGFRNCQDSLLRLFFSKLYNYIIRIVFHIRVKDINFSFKIFRNEIINNLLLKSTGPFIDAEIVIKAIRLGYRVEEISVNYLPRKYGKSKLFSFKSIISSLYEMVKLYPEIIKIKNFQ